MTAEEEQLIFKDICARIPYGLIVHSLGLPHEQKLVGYIPDIEKYNIKPYLRPLSSMTEEEKEDVKPLFKLVWTDDNKRLLVVRQNKMAEYLDYIYSHHFDFRGLIPMGLALEAPSDMYK